MKNLIVFLLLFSVATESRAKEFPAPKLSIFVLGEKKFEGSASELAKQVHPQEIKFFDPLSEKTRHFAAFDLKSILRAIKADAYLKAKTLKITCTDGYTPTVLVSSIQAGNPYLAFAAKDEFAFQIEKAKKTVELGPFYLVWTQEMTPAQRKLHVNAGNWPYQIAKLSFE
jgi:hypothetical protein